MLFSNTQNVPIPVKSRIFAYKYQTMHKVHLISITDSLMPEIAKAIKEKGFEVSVSGENLSEEQLKSFEDKGYICHGNGWFPELMNKNIQAVVLGGTVGADNPELIMAKQLGLLVQSIPDFIYHRTKSKIRVVVAGSRGKCTILSMMVAAMKQQKMAFDYATTSSIPSLEDKIHFNYESRIALIEGDEHVTSKLEKRSQLEFYRPHIAVLPNLTWELSTDHSTPEAYISTYRYFSTSIEREGKLIYYGGDPVISQLVEEIRNDITAIPFNKHEIVERDGNTYLQTRYGEYPIKVTDSYFLINLNAARLACRQIGINDKNFYQAVSEIYR